MGTGQSGIIDRSNWTTFSDQAERRIKSPQLMKCAAFKLGLLQLKDLREKLLDDPLSQVANAFSSRSNMAAEGLELLAKMCYKKRMMRTFNYQQRKCIRMRTWIGCVKIVIGKVVNINLKSEHTHGCVVKGKNVTKDQKWG